MEKKIKNTGTKGTALYQIKLVFLLAKYCQCCQAVVPLVIYNFLEFKNLAWDILYMMCSLIQLLSFSRDPECQMALANPVLFRRPSLQFLHVSGNPFSD